MKDKGLFWILWLLINLLKINIPGGGTWSLTGWCPRRITMLKPLCPGVSEPSSEHIEALSWPFNTLLANQPCGLHITLPPPPKGKKWKLEQYWYPHTDLQIPKFFSLSSVFIFHLSFQRAQPESILMATTRASLSLKTLFPFAVTGEQTGASLQR